MSDEEITLLFSEKRILETVKNLTLGVECLRFTGRHLEYETNQKHGYPGVFFNEMESPEIASFLPAGPEPFASVHPFARACPLSRQMLDCPRTLDRVVPTC